MSKNVSATLRYRLTAVLFSCAAASGCVRSESSGATERTWFRNTAPATVQVDPVTACERIQRNSGIPVACSTQYIRGVPSMIIGFQGLERSLPWIDPVLSAVAVPFCESASAARETAVVLFTFRDDQTARGYNCTSRSWTPWYSTANGSSYSRTGSYSY